MRDCNLLKGLLPALLWARAFPEALGVGSPERLRRFGDSMASLSYASMASTAGGVDCRHETLLLLSLRGLRPTVRALEAHPQPRKHDQHGHLPGSGGEATAAAAKDRGGSSTLWSAQGALALAAAAAVAASLVTAAVLRRR